jgi:hypothetical protein
MVHSAPSVADRQQHIGSAVTGSGSGDISFTQRDVLRRESNSPTLSHGGFGIHGEIHKDLLYLTRIGPNVSKPGIQIRDELNVFPNDPAKHWGAVVDDYVEIQHRRLDQLPAFEGNATKHFFHQVTVVGMNDSEEQVRGCVTVLRRVLDKRRYRGVHIRKTSLRVQFVAEDHVARDLGHSAVPPFGGPQPFEQRPGLKSGRRRTSQDIQGFDVPPRRDPTFAAGGAVDSAAFRRAVARLAAGAVVS